SPSAFRWERQIGGSSRDKVDDRVFAGTAHARPRSQRRPCGRLWPVQPRICRWQRKSGRQGQSISLGPKGRAQLGHPARRGSQIHARAGGLHSKFRPWTSAKPEVFGGSENSCRSAATAASGARRTLDPMDDERWEPGMPVLERQAVGPVPGAAPGPFGATPVPPSLAGLPPRSVPETEPTPLEKHYVLLSVPVLILGAITITALELGAPLGSPLVKLCVAIAAPLLILTT